MQNKKSAILHAPRDDESTPAHPPGVLALYTTLGRLGSSSDSDDVPSCLPGHSEAVLGSNAPKRLGGNPNAPTSRRQRADPQIAQDVGGEEFRERHASSAAADAGPPDR